MSEQILINGTDYTSYFKAKKISASFTKINGPNGGTMLDGTEVEDIIAYKYNYQRAFKPLTETQVRTILNALVTTSRVVTISVVNRKTGNRAVYNCKIGDLTASFVCTDKNNVDWYTLSDLVAKEL